ncbi:uncharacterized protein ColSpa_12716 [Colletotrichum spaethianum]|uniref:Uncharacterized protein n=1 Tax=Colletotrichum spaethianum TaxID=700344 RepID=A0AA37PHP8_9PEZI|nr:uncharacterized protein ColSpa_12716 [Colletotrichum spaethianum]GKT52535.1 hypothetical protein ColSpa_12716 [Colletotrichum spaethianum]
MQTSQKDEERASMSSSVDEMQLEEKANIAEKSEAETASVLEDDEDLSRHSTRGSLRKRSMKVRHRLQQLFRSQGSRSHTENDDSREPSTRETSGRSMNDMTYHVAAGLCWYLPAPFDLMPQGYPTRVF